MPQFFAISGRYGVKMPLNAVRNVVFSTVMLGAFVACGAAQAQGASASSEWRERFDVSTPRSFATRGTTPMLSPRGVGATQMAIQHYSEIVGRGGWPKVPDGQTLRLGATSPAVAVLRERLKISGDLEPSSGRADVFDSYVDQAVKRFQFRHGLAVDGVIKKATFDELNVPADRRLQQLQLNLPRLQSMQGFLGERYVVMNIPAAELEAVQGDAVVQRHITVIGKQDRMSPVLSVRITEVNFNPFWTVPESIIKKDLIPRMKADPQYLEKNKIKIFDWKGNAISPEWINWNTDEAVKLRFRQDPGGINSMGSVKITMPNTQIVYMHDTPQKSFFGSETRFHSSGCARVQNVRELVTWLLSEQAEWPRPRIDQVIRSDQQFDVRLRKPVPVYWIYLTAWASDDGFAYFRKDVYGRDAQHVMGDFHVAATPFESAGPQAFVPGMSTPFRAQ